MLVVCVSGSVGRFVLVVGTGEFVCGGLGIVYWLVVGCCEAGCGYGCLRWAVVIVVCEWW